MSARRSPSVIALAGPNGAGKSTVAPELIRAHLGVVAFVNADVIARGLAGFAPQAVDLTAGRIMLARLRELASAREDFAFETTLASRTFGPWLRRLRAGGYEVHLYYVWLRSPDLAVERVRRRFESGGHDVPEPIVRRRYSRSAANFFRIYKPLASRGRSLTTQVSMECGCWGTEALGARIRSWTDPRGGCSGAWRMPKRKRSVSESARDVRGAERVMRRAVARAIAERRALGLPIVAIDEPKQSGRDSARRPRASGAA